MKPVKKGTIRSHIKKGDTVVFIAGKEYNRYDSNGKRNPFRGEVMQVDPRNGKVKVTGANIIKKHRKAVPQMNIEGGIIELEAWVDVSNVALLDPETGKPTSALVDEAELPLMDASVDFALVIHGLDLAEELPGLLNEIFRVLTPQGRALNAANLPPK